MDKCVWGVVVVVVLTVGLAEIYLALSLDDKEEGGQWNITVNWTVEGQSSHTAWTHFLYPSQESTKLLINASIPENEFNESSNSVNSYKKTQQSKDRNYFIANKPEFEKIVEDKTNFIEKIVTRVKRNRKNGEISRKHIRKLPTSERERVLMNIYKPKNYERTDCGFSRGD